MHRTTALLLVVALTATLAFVPSAGAADATVDASTDTAALDAGFDGGPTVAEIPDDVSDGGGYDNCVSSGYGNCVGDGG
jgi:hypothetical protein